MTLQEVLNELIQRLGSGRDTVLAWEQVREWPNGAIEVFQQAGWIEPVVAASTVECSGCEENCFMPVHVLPARNSQPARAYVACDRRSDMGRVKIAMLQLQQWQITEAQVAGWVSGALGLKGKPERDPAGGAFTLGNLQGKKRLGLLELTTTESVSLTVSGHSLPLSEVVDVERDHLRIDRSAILELVDLPPVPESLIRAREHVKNSAENPIRRTDLELGSSEWRKQTARTAANARHDQLGGSRDKQRRMRDIWASGKYSSRDICAEQECAALGMSLSAARKALRNTPRPSRC